MAEESDLEKTEPASERRLQQAREEGNVPSSRELGSFLVLITGVSTLWGMGGWISERMRHLAESGLSLDRAQALDPQAMLDSLGSLFTLGLTALLPLCVAQVLAALAGPMALGGFNFSAKALGFKASRLNPLAGLTRIVSWSGLAELVKAVLKSLLIGGVGAWVIWSRADEAISLGGMSIESGLAGFVHLVLWATIVMVSGLAFIALIDVPFQLWQYYSRLRMTKEEVRQENKEQEGDPQIKGRIRQKQREMARRRMMQEVPKADVVVTNPTHYAVALKYDDSVMRAPRVIAKGTDLVAGQIRDIARANGIPLLEAPPLARALWRHTDIDQEVPAALYTAVAEVLAWVFSLRQAHAQGVVPPREPEHVMVPPGLDPGPAV